MWYPSGKGSVCKTVIGWFDSNPHLERIAQKAVLFFRAGHGKAAVRLHIYWLPIFRQLFYRQKINLNVISYYP